MNDFREALENYYSCKNHVEATKLYNIELHPNINKIVNNALVSIGVYKNNYMFDELYQEATISILIKYKKHDNITNVKNIHSYTFIVAKNRMLDVLRSNNVYREFKNKINDIVNDENSESFGKC